MAFEEAYALYRLAKVEALSEGGKEQVSNSTKTTIKTLPDSKYLFVLSLPNKRRKNGNHLRSS